MLALFFLGDSCQVGAQAGDGTWPSQRNLTKERGTRKVFKVIQAG